MKRKMVCYFSILMVCFLCMPVKAANAGRFLWEGYEVEEDRLRIMGSRLPPGGELKVTVGTQREVPAEFRTVEEAGLPTTVFCLADISGSMKEEQMEQMRGAMRAVSDAMGEEDNMVLVAMGEEVAVGEPLFGREAREEAIDALQPGSAYTNLYQGVIESIDLLATSTAYHNNRCLVIFSDGKDDHRTGATREEAEEAVHASTVPVYAVAVLSANAGAEDQEYGKQLRSFATISLGGKGYTPMLDGMDSKETGEDIWRSMQENSVISVDLGSLEYDGSRDSLLLKAVYEAEEARYEDTMLLYLVDLPLSREQESGEDSSSAEEEPTPEPSDDPGRTPEPEPEPEPGGNIFLWGAALGIAGAAAAAIILLLRRGKKGKEASSEESPEEPMGAISRKEPVGEESLPEPAMGIREKKESRRTCRITLTAIGQERKKCTFLLEEHRPKTLGRGKRADILLDEADSKLSGVHCELEWDGEWLSVRDRKSTNGSFVNGVPTQAETWMPLEDSSLLRVGAYEYRVSLGNGDRKGRKK